MILTPLCIILYMIILENNLNKNGTHAGCIYYINLLHITLSELLIHFYVGRISQYYFNTFYNLISQIFLSMIVLH